MKIAHGGFQRTVAHRLLNRPRIDPVFHAMRCIAVAKFGRHDRNTEFMSGVSDSLRLEVGLPAHPVTDFKACAWMKTGGRRDWKSQAQGLKELAIGVFDSELMRQRNGDSASIVLPPDGFGKFHL